MRVTADQALLHLDRPAKTVIIGNPATPMRNRQ
jgi:hypothetical protein